MKVNLACYGSVTLPRAMCPDCKEQAFILHGEFSCCGREAPCFSEGHTLTRESEKGLARGRLSKKRISKKRLLELTPEEVIAEHVHCQNPQLSNKAWRIKNIFEPANWTCRICGRKVSLGGYPYRDDYAHVDHRRAKCRGGRNVMSNLQCLCRKCNLGKRGRSGAEIMRKIDEGMFRMGF